MNRFKEYFRKGSVLVRPVTQEDISEYVETGAIATIDTEVDDLPDCWCVSISEADRVQNKSPKIGDMIAVNKDNTRDQWLIEETYFKNHYHTEEFGGLSIADLITESSYNNALYCNELAKHNGVNFKKIDGSMISTKYGVHKSKKSFKGEYFHNSKGEIFVVAYNLPTGLVYNFYHKDFWDYFNVPETENSIFDFNSDYSPKLTNIKYQSNYLK